MPLTPISTQLSRKNKRYLVCCGVLGKQIEVHTLKQAPQSQLRDVIGAKLDSLESVMKRGMLQKLQSVLENSSHRLHQLLVQHSGAQTKRLCAATSKAEHPSRSFLLQFNCTTPPRKKHSVPGTFTFIHPVFYAQLIPLCSSF